MSILKETFRSYCDYGYIFFQANDLVFLGGADSAVADAVVVMKNNTIFLTVIGANILILVNDLLAPRSTKEVGLNEVTNVLKAHKGRHQNS